MVSGGFSLVSPRAVLITAYAGRRFFGSSSSRFLRFRCTRRTCACVYVGGISFPTRARDKTSTPISGLFNGVHTYRYHPSTHRRRDSAPDSRCPETPRRRAHGPRVKLARAPPTRSFRGRMTHNPGSAADQAFGARGAVNIFVYTSTIYTHHNTYMMHIHIYIFTRMLYTRDCIVAAAVAYDFRPKGAREGKNENKKICL